MDQNQRTKFVDQLLVDGRIAKGQEASVRGLARTLSNSAFAAWAKTLQPPADLADAAQILAAHRASGMGADEIAQTKSFATYRRLVGVDWAF
jgi:hypothetical protein